MLAPGTVVTNNAFLVAQSFEEDRCAPGGNLIVSTNLDGIAFQFAPEMPCASVSFVIAQEPVDPTPTPTEAPVETTTPEPGTTPTPAPADPSDPATPAADAAVTSLPKTGSGGMLQMSAGIYGALAATFLLFAGSLAIRVRGRQDRA